jgi:tetratricopeptide (TPR) repeat protein
VDPLDDDGLETVEETEAMEAPIDLEPLGYDDPTDTMSTQTAVAFEDPEALAAPVDFHGPGPLDDSVTFEDAGPYDDQAGYDEPTQQLAREERVEAPPDDDPLSEECDEANFFLEQGVTDEAREILETVLIASPGHPRATELLAQLEALEASSAAEPTQAAAPLPVVPAAEERDAFDLAAELADELGELQEEEDPLLTAPSSGDYQVSVEEVFSEFKKGLAKVVKPEDVETHYDLGIAYKEMGLIDDAIGEFNVAREGCRGKKKEIDCLSMIGLLALQKGDGAEAVSAFQEALANEFAKGDAAKGILYELAVAHEAAGSLGKALFCFQQVAQQDASFRDVTAQVDRLATQTSPEAVDLPQGPPRGKPPTHPSGAPAAARPASAAPAAPPKSRKVGYL